jgi:hypothetical protein
MPEFTLDANAMTRGAKQIVVSVSMLSATCSSAEVLERVGATEGCEKIGAENINETNAAATDTLNF